MMTVLAFFVTLGVLITFHELGHYSVARACSVRVLRFSIGFGKVLIKRTDKQGTEWAISLIPLGGYVKMLEEPTPGGSVDEQHCSFKSKPVAARFAIVAAGPVFNLVLAVVLYAALNLVGVKEPVPVISAVPENTAAALAGFQAGDRITSVGDVTTLSWGQVRYQLLREVTEGGSADVTVDRRGLILTKRINFDAPVTTASSNVDPLKLAGLRLSQGRPIINQVVAGGVAESAGLQSGDVVQAVGDLADPDVAQLIDFIQANPEKLVQLKVERGDQKIVIDVRPRLETPENGARLGRIGVQLSGEASQVLVQYDLLDSVWQALVRTVDTSVFSIKMMGKMIVGEVSWRNVSGPLTIADYAGQTVKLGLSAYISFLALISISLGVLNLLPIPMLDGGYLLYYLIEIVTGKPPAEKWLDLAQKAGMGLLACLMVLALFNDFVRLLS